MALGRALRSASLLLLFQIALAQDIARAGIGNFRPIDSDYLFIDGVRTVIPETQPPACNPNCETIFTIGPFDKAVIVTEGMPVVTNPAPGLFTVQDVSDAIWQKDGRVFFNSAPDCVPSCTLTFDFDPRGVISLVNESADRDIYPTIGLFDPGDPNTKIVSFQSDPIPVEVPRANPPRDAARSGGSTLSYDASSDVISFSGHHLVDTGFAGDPILGADVLIPDFQPVVGNEDGVVLLIARTDPTFEIASGGNVYLRGRLTLDYRSQQNEFLGILTDLTFSSFGSPWIDAMADLFNPASPNFDRDRKLYFGYAPRDNFLALTQTFNVDAVSGGGDLLFAALSVPEPWAPGLLALALVAMIATRSVRGPSASRQRARVGDGSRKSSWGVLLGCRRQKVTDGKALSPPVWVGFAGAHRIAVPSDR